MTPGMNKQYVTFEVPATVATNATSASTVDTLGFDFATVIFPNVVATATNASAKWTSLTVSHGTTTDASNHTTISGLQGTTNTTASSTQFVLATSNNTSLGGMQPLFVDMRGKERILRFVKQAKAAHSTTCGIAILERAADTPDSGPDMISGAVVAGVPFG